MRQLLMILTTVVAALALAACADTRVATNTEEPASTAPATRPSTSTGGAAPTAADGTGGGETAGDDGPVGSAGPLLLSPASPSVVIEIDRSPNAGMHVDARAVLAEELREHGGKTSIAAGADSAVPAQDVYTAGDLRQIADSHRQARSEPTRPAIYVLVLQGRYENERVTGVAFSATAFAVFPGQISVGLLGTNPDAFETAVVVHELGHLFGLVDLTGEGDFHEDHEHPGHSSSDASVMYWAVEDISIANVFRGGPPQEFDAADQNEMARIRR